MNRYDFVVGAYAFTHVRNSTFRIHNRITKVDTVLYYDFEKNIRINYITGREYKDGYPIPNIEYRKWLFKKQLKEVLDKAE